VAQIKPITFMLEKNVFSSLKSVKTYNSFTRTGCSLSAKISVM